MPIPYWRLSGFYFFYFAALGGFLPFWSLYLQAAGFSPLQIGELTALLVGTKIVSPNLWGWLADVTGRSLRIIRLTSFFAAAIFAGFLYFKGYFWAFWLTIGFSFFWNAALPQFEALTLVHLQADSHRYSRIRLWGSVGFIGAVLGIGQVIKYYAIDRLPIVICSMLGAIWVISLVIPDAQKPFAKAVPVSMGSILKKPEVLAFLVTTLLVQVSHGPYYVFYSIYLNQFHYPASVIGGLWGIGVFAEIILFLLMSRVLKRYSVRQILLISVLAGVLRWVLIAGYAARLEILLAAQLLHAATFGSMHVGAVNLVQRYFGSRHQGKGQAIYTSMSFGLGGMLGSLYSGYYWESLGPQWVFSIAAFCCIAAFIIAYTCGVGAESKSKAMP